MSQAAKSDSEEGLGNVLACTQCNERVRPEASRDARHGLPCGHIVCGPCTAKIGVEQKESPTEAVCRSAGCGRTFEHASEFFTAWCVQREARLAGALTDLLKDQGDRGCEGKALTEAVFDVAASARKDDAGSWGLCTKHSKEISALHAVTLHALCGDCPERDEDGVSEVSAAVAGLAKTEGTLEQFAGQIDSCDLAPQDLRAGVDKWASDEAKRIKAWEEREVKAVHAVAAEALALVEETRARRLEVGASVLRQLLGLRTTISELVYELAHPPAGKAASLQHALALATEQRRLAALLSEGRLALPAPATVEAWAEPPTLASCFDISPANGAPLSTATGAAATLSLRLLRDLGPGAVAGRLVPVMPKLNPGHRVQHFPILHTWPSVITAVDDQFAVVGFYSSTPLQLWDLKNLRKVRDFDGDNKYCSQIINLPAATIAAVGSRGSDGYVAIYNILSGKRLHELTGHTPIVATAYSGGHLFTLGHSDKQLRVWRQTSSGNFVRDATFDVMSDPTDHVLVPLSDSLIAVTCTGPPTIQIIDWVKSSRRQVISGFPTRIKCATMLSGGRLLTASIDGALRVCRIDLSKEGSARLISTTDWQAADPTNSDIGIVAVLAAKDDVVATVNHKEEVQIWRDGWVERTFPLQRKQGMLGVSLSIVDDKLLVAGYRDAVSFLQCGDSRS